MMQNNRILTIMLPLLIMLLGVNCGGGSSGNSPSDHLNGESVTLYMDQGGSVRFPENTLSANREPAAVECVSPTLPSEITATGEAYHISDVGTLYGLAEIRMPVPQTENGDDLQIVKVSKDGLLTILDTIVEDGQLVAKTDSFSALSPALVPIEVSPIIGGPDFLPMGETVRFQETRFSATRPDSLNLEWAVYGPGEIVSIEGRDVLVKATDEGAIDVTVTATNPQYGYNGFASKRVSAQKLVSPQDAQGSGQTSDSMVVLISGGPTSVEFGDSVTFTGKAVNAGSDLVTWTWDTGSSTVYGDSCNGCGNPYTFPPLVYDQLGKYVFSVNAFDQTGNEDDSEVEVIVRPKALAVTIQGPREVEFKASQKVEFVATVVNQDAASYCDNLNFEWTFNPYEELTSDVTSRGTSSFTAKPKEPGTYLIDLVVLCRQGVHDGPVLATCKVPLTVKGDSDPLDISITSIPKTIAVDEQVDMEMRIRGGVTVISGVRGKYTVEVHWNDPANTITTDEVTAYSSEQGGFANPRHTYKKAGNYTVEIKVTDAAGNFSGTSATIKVTDDDDNGDDPEDNDDDGSFSATIAVPGHTVSFHPDPSFSTASEISGQNDYITMVAYEDPLNALNSSSMQFIIDTNQVKGPGAYPIGLTLTGLGEGFSEGAATMTFFTDDIRNSDDGSPVIFAAEGGTITFTEFSSNSGGRIKGTFTANIVGNHVSGIDNDGDDITEELTGTVTGSFNLTLK